MIEVKPSRQIGKKLKQEEKTKTYEEGLNISKAKWQA